MRILVTGGGGFIGRHVVAALEPHGEIIAPRSAGGGDLLDPAARRRIVETARAELLVHLAWVTEHGKFWSSSLNAEWEAASGDLFEAFYAAGGRRVVALGSCAEYDWQAVAGPVGEDAPLRPHTLYGDAKVRACEILEAAAARHDGTWAWGRVFFLFGPGEPPGRLVPAMIRAALDRTMLDCGPGETERDFWDVRNLGAAIAALALSGVEGAVNLGSGQATSFAELATEIEAICGAEGLIRCGRRALGPGDVPSLVADTTRLRDEVGFVPRIALREGLRDYVNVLGASR